VWGYFLFFKDNNMKTLQAIFITAAILGATGYLYAAGAQGDVGNANKQQVDNAVSSTIHNATTDIVADQMLSTTVIAGGFGTGPGEFGAIDPNEAETLGVVHSPISIAVDSKGHVYVLDVFNNRIQEFNAEGRFVADIPVQTLTDDKGKSVIEVVTSSNGHKIFRIKNSYLIGTATMRDALARGTNIVIDSRDNLYYYIAKSSVSEIVQFQNRQFKDKWTIPVVDRLGGLQIDLNDDLWVGEYNATKKKRTARNTSAIRFRDGRTMRLEKRSDAIALYFEGNGQEKIRELSGGQGREHWVSTNARMNRTGRALVNWGFFYKGARQSFLDTYTPNGELIARSKLPPAINFRWCPTNDDGDVYQLVYSDSDIRVLKWMRSGDK